MLNVNKRPIFTQTIFEGTPDSFTATFRAKTLEELAAFDETRGAGQVALLEAVTVDLEDVSLSDDKAEPFTPELLAAALDLLHVRKAMLTAYWQGLGRLVPGN